jgi:very-short-patch-repair endonuclease
MVKKAIIELWGDYFHKGENPKDREEIFGRSGYKTLIIWASELKDLRLIASKVNALLS